MIEEHIDRWLWQFEQLEIDLYMNKKGNQAAKEECLKAMHALGEVVGIERYKAILERRIQKLSKDIEIVKENTNPDLEEWSGKSVNCLGGIVARFRDEQTFFWRVHEIIEVLREMLQHAKDTKRNDLELQIRSNLRYLRKNFLDCEYTDDVWWYHLGDNLNDKLYRLHKDTGIPIGDIAKKYIIQTRYLKDVGYPEHCILVGSLQGEWTRWDQVATLGLASSVHKDYRINGMPEIFFARFYE